MINIIFDKTDKGREEITTRKHHLASKLRPLLVMIDGKHTAEELLKKVAGLGIDLNGLNELRDNGFIHLLDAVPVPGATDAAPDATASVAATPPAEPAREAPPGVLAEGETQLQALHNFFNETVKSMIGLRGFGLQLKVERASTVEDFRAIREAYLEAILKAKGNEIAHSLRNRLDELLNLHLPPP